MNTPMHITTLVGTALVVVFLAGCGGASDNSDTPRMVHGGSWYETGYQWPHDGSPLESENFVIYSDAASLEAKQQVSQICEDAFAAIKQSLEIVDDSVFRFPSGRNDKIHIYAYRNHLPEDWGGQAYYGGYMIYSPDHPEKTALGLTSANSYVPLIRHEMMHVIQTLILGALDESLLAPWFSEGIAIEISNDTFYERIETQTRMDELTLTYRNLNPLSLQYSWTYPEIEGVATYYYYPMFWLSVRYLTDPNGQGGSFLDVRNVLIDVANGVAFDTSLANRFGIGAQEYERQFFALMKDFLN